MANVLDNLAADIYKAADVVGRELVGFIPSATINANGSERAAKGDNVRASFTRAATAVNVAESMTIPEGTDQTLKHTRTHHALLVLLALRLSVLTSAKSPSCARFWLTTVCLATTVKRL